MSNLKPCPFCGGEAKHESIKSWNPEKEEYVRLWHRVICTKCRVGTKSFYTEAEAIEAWNRRAETTVETLMRVFAYDATCGVCDKRKERTAKVEAQHIVGDQGRIYEYGSCCSCGASVIKPDKYCSECGAKLDWRDGNE